MSSGASDIRLTLTLAAPRSRNRFSLSRSSGAPPMVTGRGAGSRPSVLRHLTECWQVFLGIAARGVLIPTVAVADRASRRPWKGAAENDRRIPVCRLAGTTSGPCSALPEPLRTQSSHRYRYAPRQPGLACGPVPALPRTASAALRYWNTARQRYYRRLT